MIGVALKYLPNVNHAPVVIAKGEGVLGDLIYKIAQKNGIPIISNPPLAELLKKVPVDREIPENLYKAVAGITNF
ncbi:MAG: EscU/YscU/HrcU family type III secretion system export apparatus switch protein [Leptospiraceae bacterium]|nr:EscU/YscU/HrcU family type III secretion system export apparatus switch protein [Leptospiraceae bacterium]